MYKLLFVLTGLLIVVNMLHGQQRSMEEILESVETNNKSLTAFRSYAKGQTWEYRSENKLPPLQASAYYLPFGNHEPDNYIEFEVSQSFELPSVYSARDKWIGQQRQKLDLEYDKLRQELLLEAKQLALHLIFLERQRELTTNRVAQSRQVYEQVQTLFEKGETGILELNKAKIVWLDQQFSLEELASRRVKILQELQGLNGGMEMDPQLDQYPAALQLPSLDSLWQQKQNRDAAILVMEQEMEVAGQRIQVEEKQLLPDFTAGLSYQGVRGDNYTGIYGGINIPLWSGKDRINMAEARLEFRQQQKEALVHSLHSELQARYQRYEYLLAKYRQYRDALDGLGSEELLLRTYELGEISFLDYYREISFYRDAENRMLEMEKELQQLRAELFKHQL